MFKIGEALVGKGNEVAHVDLMIGDKDSQVGEAFANGMTQLSQGHTPLLSVIRPNLPAKPYTLVVPKVTVQDLEDAEKIFGPAQAAVAKAVADSVEEGVIDEDQVEDLLLVVSVFIHPEAENYRRIYQYNYGATKLALKRALNDYPSNDKIMYDKDRAVHPMMGFRVPRLPKWNSPYLQIALDVPDLDRIKHVINELPESDKLLLEAGTPLIKKYGTKVIGELRDVTEKDFVIADLKTLDVGKVEVDLAFEEGADAVVASGLAEAEVLDKFIYEAKRLGIYSIVDTMNVEDPVDKLKQLKEDPEVVILHRCVDAEEGQKQRWHLIEEIKKEYPNVLVAVAGGINPQTAPEAIKQGADIIIVGRYITQAKDVKGAVREFLEFMGKDIDVGRVHVE